MESNILFNERFLRANKYDPMWIFGNELGPNALWLTEFLVEPIDLKPGMRVLDLGCGKGMTSVFLAREFGVQVYAVDLWENADGKWELAKQSGVEHLIVPIHGDARELPFAKGFFDVVLCVDSYIYFGANDAFLGNITEFLRPGGKIGMVVPGFMGEITDGRPVPEYLKQFLSDELWTWKTLSWWKQLWEKSGLVSVDVADTMEDGCTLWLSWKKALQSAGKNRHPEEFESDVEMFEKDGGEYIGFIRLVGTKR